MQYRLLVAENPGNPHWTFKAWKAGVRNLPDSLRPAARYYRRPAARPVEPMLPRSLLQPRQ